MRYGISRKILLNKGKRAYRKARCFNYKKFVYGHIRGVIGAKGHKRLFKKWL